MTALLLLAALAAHAAPADPQRIVSAIREFDAHSNDPIPVPKGKDLTELSEGHLVRIRQVTDPDAPQRVIGLQIFHHTKSELWVATGDDDYNDVQELHYVDLKHLPPPAPGHRYLQYLDVPWPFADRYWVIDTWDNLDLVKATGDRMWENPWRLVDGGEKLARKAIRAGKLPGVGAEMLGKAIYTPVNRGAWLAISLDDHATLFGYHVTSVVGGAIPDDLVARYSMHTLRRIFHGAASRFPQILTHYDADHEPIVGGDDKPIPPFSGGRGGANTVTASR